MPQDMDGSAIILLLWVAWIYWSIWNKITELRAADEDARKERLHGAAAGGGSATADKSNASPPKIDASRRKDASRNRDVASALLEIERRDRSFSVDNFLTGARAAYEAITAAFASGDRAMLKSCLSHEVYEDFVAAIAERESRGERMETSLVRVGEPEVVDVRLDEDEAEVSVRFVSELFSVTRNATGTVVRGNPRKCAAAVDIWTFAKCPASRDPVWKLVASNTA
jgi:predicted lipid-binding transport protein (Tim44 family)